MIACWASWTRVFGSGPEIKIVPSSAKPMMKMLVLSKSWSKLSKIRFQAIELKTNGKVNWLSNGLDFEWIPKYGHFIQN